MPKAKQTGKKTRKHSIRADFGAAIAVDRLELMQNGTIRFWSEEKVVEPKRVTVAITQPRELKTPKIVSQWPSPPGAVHHNPTAALSRFAHVFAVDTNTRDGVSVTCIVRASPPRSEGSGWLSEIGDSRVIEFRDASMNSERVGWALALARITAFAEYRSGAEVSLIVDSHLGEHDGINGREAPLVGKLDLPPRVALIYASSERDTEEMPNRLMAICDKNAGAVLAKCRSEHPPFTDFPEAYGFRRMRAWTDHELVV